MKFRHIVKFYKLNDDCTVTVQVGDQYYRCKARFDLLKALIDRGVKLGDDMECQFGIAYVRGQGMIIQLIEVL